MNNSKPIHDNWDPCHPGLIHETACPKGVFRRRFLKLVGCCIFASVVGSSVFLGLNWSEGKKEQNSELPAGIACITVIDHLSRFMSGQVTDEKLESRIAIHLLKCKDCRGSYDKRCSYNSSGCETRRVKATLKPCTEKFPSPSP